MSIFSKTVNYRRLLRFAAVGLTAHIIDVGIYNALVHLGPSYLNERPLTAKVISSAVAVTYAFAANRNWTFQESETAQQVHSKRYQYLSFLAVNAAAAGVAITCLAASRYILDLNSAAADNISANVIGLVAGALVRYWGYSQWVFATKLRQPQQVGQTQPRQGQVSESSSDAGTSRQCSTGEPQHHKTMEPGMRRAELQGPRLLEAAKRLASDAHQGQRDGIGAPYSGHLARVAAYAEMRRGRESKELNRWEVAATAYLHDALEDTQLDRSDLERAGMPETVLAAVELLTHRAHQPREEYLSQIAVNPLARLVKIADTDDNSNPGRLAQLQQTDPERAARLQRKYRHAQEVLQAN